MQARFKSRPFAWALVLLPALVSAGEPVGSVADISAADAPGLEFFRGPLDFLKARQLFERETFGGNGRTCLTCHSRETGTVSPADARKRYSHNRKDPLFIADGSDDGAGHGTKRMLEDATFLVRIPLPDNVRLANDPKARSVVVRRGAPSTLNTPALDPVLMQDGRQPDLVAQARGAIFDHAQVRNEPRQRDLELIAAYQHTPQFFSSATTFKYAYFGTKPKLPKPRTASETRGQRFFLDVPLEGDFKSGLCANCHSGPMLNETNEFAVFPPFGRGGRFQSVGVSEMNIKGNPVYDFVITHPDGTTTTVSSPDPGRALINGSIDFESLNAFKIPSLWGVSRTAPYFHDNSAKNLDEVVQQYARFFGVLGLTLTEQDQKDLVAYMKLMQ